MPALLELLPDAPSACGCLARISSRFATAAGGRPHSTPLPASWGRNLLRHATGRGLLHRTRFIHTGWKVWMSDR